jgi:hypothetical protein
LVIHLRREASIEFAEEGQPTRGTPVEDKVREVARPKPLYKSGGEQPQRAWRLRLFGTHAL